MIVIIDVLATLVEFLPGIISLLHEVEILNRFPTFVSKVSYGARRDFYVMLMMGCEK